MKLMSPRMALLSGTIALVSLLPACGRSSSTTARLSSQDDHLALEKLFFSAGAEFRVPPVVVEAVAYVETRWHRSLPESADVDDAHLKGFGVMGLRETVSLGQSLERAAQLVGKPPADLKTSDELNIRGGAALLRELAGSTASSTDPSDWIDAVRKYSGIPGLPDANSYAREVFRVVRDGISGSGIEILPVAVNLPPELINDPAPQPSPSASPAPAPSGTPAASKPVVAWDPSPNFTSGGLPSPRYIVIHDTEGDFATSVSWLKNTTAAVSAHYVIRSSDGYIKQLVGDHDRAWHARCWNDQAIGIEHEGYMSRPEKYFTDAMYNQSARLVNYLTALYSIPRTNVRIIGHNAGTMSWFGLTGLDNCNDHLDPGPGWDWARYLGLVSTPPTAASAEELPVRPAAPGCRFMDNPGSGQRCCTSTTDAAYLSAGATPWCALERLERVSASSCALSSGPSAGTVWRCRS